MNIKVDYIDKTYAKNIVKAILHMPNITSEAAVDLICGAIGDDTSAEDVIRVTHCRDCYWFAEGSGCTWSSKDYHYDPDYEDPPILPDCGPDDYCSKVKPTGVFKQ